MSVINEINFDFYSNEEIIEMSAVEITNKTSYGNGTGGTDNGLEDYHLGVFKGNKLCKTCNQNYEICPGHFGHITLPFDILNPLTVDMVVKFLNIFCHRCSRLYIRKEHIKIFNMEALTPKELLNYMLSINKTSKECIDCKIYGKTYTREKEADKDKSDKNKIFVKNHRSNIKDEFEVKYIKAIFDNINPEDIKLLHITHPSNLIMNVVPVLPITARTYIESTREVEKENFTSKLKEILTAKDNLYKINLDEKNSNYKKLKNKLINKVIEYYDNSPSQTSFGNNSSGLKQFISASKSGVIDAYVNSKRINNSGRIVIGPDPNLKLHQIGLPDSVADKFGIYEYVGEHNLNSINLDNIISVRKPNYRSKNIKDIKIGDIIERKLQTGDWIIVNRNPTLHRGSTAGFEVVRDPNATTMRFNTPACGSFNADFDGDQMNILVLRKLESQIETKELANIKNHIISAKHTGKLNVKVIHDTILALYDMTTDMRPITKKQFLRIVKVITVENTHKYKDKKEYLGKEVLDVLFPKDMTLLPYIKNVKFIYDKPLNKTIINSKLIYNTHMMYGKEVSSNLIDSMQFIGTEWLFINGYSISLHDFEIPHTPDVTKYLVKADLLTDENRIIIELDSIREKIKDDVFKFIPENNEMLKMIKSQSKGSTFNIQQIYSLIGQQLVVNERGEYTLNNGKRALPNYDYDNLSLEDKFASRGFIFSNFNKGLSAIETFYYVKSSRDGFISNQKTVAKPGYSAKQLGKNLENNVIQEDGSVMDNGKITSFKY